MNFQVSRRNLEVPNVVEEKANMATGGMSLSKEFFELLKAIGESKSKQEEDRIVQKEVTRLKSKLENTPGNPHHSNTLLTSKKRAKEFLVRLLYVEMLGHDGSFGYIKAVEMAASASLFHKRTGYLVCGACLPPSHEFRFMLVNQMQRDLQSTNVLECSGGLLACTNLITADMVPAVANEVSKLLQHDSATIRKKAILCLHRCHQLADDVVTSESLHESLRKLVCDKDPSVMGSSLNVIEALSLTNPAPFKDLVPSLVSILKQICEHRLPSEFDYHRVPAPWMQLKLVRILGLLGKADMPASKGMYEILHETLRKADTGINAGYAIVYECVITIIAIYPNANLLDAAAEAIARFMQSRSHNLQYLGVTGLAMIVEQHPQYAAQHQLAVMDCLEDDDETLQRKTLDLLYRMTNVVNVEFIAEKLVEFLRHTTDLFLKQTLTTRVCSIAERYAPNNAWYIRTITSLLEVSGDMVPTDVAQNLMTLLAEGTGEDDEEADMLLRQTAVEIYVTMLQEKSLGQLPKILLETMAWCLGEYGYLSAVYSLDQVLQRLCQMAMVVSQTSKWSASTRKCLVTAILKLVAQVGTCPGHAANVIDHYTRSCDADLQQRCLEFQSLLTSCPSLLPEIFPVDASAEDLQVDMDLSFLDGYVQSALSNGARAYAKPEDDDDEDDEAGYGRGLSSAGATAFNMTPYEKPQTPAHAMRSMGGMSSTGRSSSQGVALPPGGVGYSSGGQSASLSSPAPAGAAAPGALQLNTRNVANVWGKGGLATATQSTNQQGGNGAASISSTPSSAPNSNNNTSSTWGDHQSTTNTGSYGGQYGSSGANSAPAPVPEPVKTAQQLEKERQAAGLFGGIVPGAPPPAPTQASAPAAAPPSVHVPAPTSPAATEVDLLDLGAWDIPGPESAPVVNFDPSDPTPAPGAATVETVSDDEEEGVLDVTPAAPAPIPAPVIDDDPFASAGLLGSVEHTPLAPLAVSSSKFEFNGSPLTPMPITTAQFGQKWGSCPHTSPLSVLSIKVTTLDKFMETCIALGAHAVEAIGATNEGICAGMVNGGSQVALIHSKLTPTPTGTRIDATVKSSDASMGGSLAMYLQTMLR